jgi:hypothetical protein
MAIPWATNLLHFHLNKLFEKGFVIWVLFCLAAVLATFQNTGRFFSKASGHPAINQMTVHPFFVCQMSVSQMSFCQMFSGQVSLISEKFLFVKCLPTRCQLGPFFVDQMSFGEMPFCQMLFDLKA